jgi:hypothetical protein
VENLLVKKPHLKEFLHEVPADEDEKDLLKDLFGEEQ